MRRLPPLFVLQSFVVALLSLFLATPALAVAQSTGYNMIAPLPGLSTGVTLSQYLTGIFQLTIGLAGVLAVVMLVICGIQLMTSGSVSGKGEAKKCIWGAVFGILIALGAWLLLNTVNPLLVGSTLTLTPSNQPAVTPTNAPSAANGALGMSAPTAQVNENGGTITITVTNADPTTASTVQYMTYPLSATPGTNYTPVAGTLTFAVGQTTGFITIRIIDDQFYNGGSPLTFGVQILSSTGASIGGSNTTLVTIIDNEPPTAPTGPPAPPVAPPATPPGAPQPKPVPGPGCTTTPPPACTQTTTPLNCGTIAAACSAAGYTGGVNANIKSCGGTWAANAPTSRYIASVPLNGAMVYCFTAPPASTKPVSAVSAEYQGPPVNRMLTLSDAPCGGNIVATGSGASILWFTSGMPYPGNTDPNIGMGYFITHPMPMLTPGQTYCVTETIDPSLAASQCSATNGDCGTFIDGPDVKAGLPTTYSAGACVSPPPATSPPPSNWNGQCPGYAATHVYKGTWDSTWPLRIYPSDLGGMGPNDATVFQFTTPAATSLATQGLWGVEYGSPTSPRDSALSATPCDFTGGSGPGTVMANDSGSTGAWFTVGPNTKKIAALLPSTTYYLNVKISPNSTCAGTGVCDIDMDGSVRGPWTPVTTPPSTGPSCPATDPSGIPYNNNLPLAPMTNWTAAQLYSYWKSLPTDSYVSAGDGNDCIRFEMYNMATNNAQFTNGKAFIQLMVAGSFGGDFYGNVNPWINANAPGQTSCRGGLNPSTGIAFAMDWSNNLVAMWPASGIPRTVACGAGAPPSTCISPSPTPSPVGPAPVPKPVPGPGPSPVGPPPSSNWNGQCPGYASTHVIDIPWPTAASPQAQVFTDNYGGFGPNDAVVVRFTTPSNIPLGTGKGSVTATEYNGVPSQRDGALSTKPCDFSTGVAAFADNQAPWVYFLLPGSKTGGAVTLAAGTTYYFNISNSPGSNCQYNGSCAMQITFTKPSGS